MDTMNAAPLFADSGTAALGETPAFGTFDASVLEDLHARLSTPLKRLFKSYRLDAADADDLCQEVFLRLAGLGAGISLLKPEAFVFTLARNLLRDRARRLYIRAGARSVTLDQIELTSEEPTPDERLEIEQALEQAEVLLASLKPKTRDAFVMHRVHGESYTCIAERMQVSVSMVEKHIMSANSMLRRAAVDTREPWPAA
jgi:RNA polymerase sigma-70 factor (ECF subfamily)